MVAGFTTARGRLGQRAANKATEAALAGYPGGIVDRVVKLTAMLPVRWSMLRATRITDDTAGRAISHAMAT